MFDRPDRRDDIQSFYNSGCSPFALLTSRCQHDRLTDANSKELAYNAKRFGDAVPAHHKASEMLIRIGTKELPGKRISHAELYSFMPVAFERFISGGFLGNKTLTESALNLDLKSNVFVVSRTLVPRKRDSSNGYSLERTKWNSISVSSIVNHDAQVNLMFHTATFDASLTIKSCEESPSAYVAKEVLVET